MEIVKVYGSYQMKLRPMMKHDRDGNPTKESTAQVSLWDISQKLPLIWSRTLQIDAAHAAMTIFESIGPYAVN
jgi:hypothetical protein